MLPIQRAPWVRRSGSRASSRIARACAMSSAGERDSSSGRTVLLAGPAVAEDSPGGAVSPGPASASLAQRFERPGRFAVGVRRVVLVDESRDDPFTGSKRTLVTEIWYPAATGETRRTSFADFFSPFEKEAERRPGTDT